MTKRERRRIEREKTHGPERVIVSTSLEGIDTLTCGHTYNSYGKEPRGNNPAKYRRCMECLKSVIMNPHEPKS